MNNENDIFISYSRRDSDFVKDLVAALKTMNVDPWIDTDDIPKGRGWWQEIKDGIGKSNAFIFVASSNSWHSMVCNWELAEALALSKKVIPLLYTDIFEDKELLAIIQGLEWDNPDGKIIHAGSNFERFQAINCIRYCDNNDLAQTADEIIRAIQTDYDYLNEHTRLLQRALEWHNKGRKRAFLLSDEALTEAGKWLEEAKSSGVEPPPSNLHEEFIKSSQKNEHNRKRNISITSGITTIILGFLFLVSIMFYRSRADESAQRAVAEATVQRQTTIDTSLDLMEQSQRILKENDPDLALALAYEAASIENPPKSVQAAFAEIVQASHTIQVFSGHGSAITSIDVNMMESMIASGGADTEVRLYNLETGDEICRLSGHNGPITSVQFSTNGQSIVSSSTDGLVCVWNTNTCSSVTCFDGHSGTVAQAIFTPDAQMILSASAQNEPVSLYLWNTNDGTVVRSYRLPDEASLDGMYRGVLSIALDDRNNRVLAGVPGKPARVEELCLWNFETGVFIECRRLQTVRFHRGISGIAFNADQQVAILGNSEDGVDNDPNIYAYSLTENEIISTFSNNAYTSAVAISPDGKIAATASGNNLVIWDVETGNELMRLYGHIGIITDIKFLLSDDRILSASTDGTMRLWDLTGQLGSPELLNRFPILAPYNSRLTGNLLFTNDHTLVSWSSPDISIFTWNLNDDQEVESTISASELEWVEDPVQLIDLDNDQVVVTLHDGTVAYVDCPRLLCGGLFTTAVAPDNSKIGLGLSDGSVLLWNVSTETLNLLGKHAGFVSQIMFSQAGKLMLSGSSISIDSSNTSVEFKEDFSIRLWDTISGQQLSQYMGHSHGIFCLDFMPGENEIISGSIDGTVRIWDVRTSVELYRFNPGTVLGCAISPNGNYFAAIVEEENDIPYALVWNLPTFNYLYHWTENNRYIRELSCAESAEYLSKPCVD